VRAVLPVLVSTSLGSRRHSRRRRGSADISTKLSGYAATGVAFKAVSAPWVQPTADGDRTTSETQSFFWVGLGGDFERSMQSTTARPRLQGERRGALLRVVRDSGREAVHIGARPAGDRIQASASRGGRVGLRLRNSRPAKASSGRADGGARRLVREWIAEAPTAVLARDQVIPL